MNELAARGLGVRYDEDVHALRDVTWNVDVHRIHALIGPNGAGKSTLLHAIAGLVAPTSGHALVGGDEVAALSHRERARRIAVMPQTAPTPPGMTVRDVVATARYARVGPFSRLSPSDWGVVDDALAQVDAAAFAERDAHQLSGGERQRVWLARALAQEAPFLLLDEPTASLDPAHQVAILDLLRRIVATRDCAVVFVTHDLNLASQVADRIALLHEGKLVAEGTPDAVLSSEVLRPVYGGKLAFGSLHSKIAAANRPWVLPWWG